LKEKTVRNAQPLMTVLRFFNASGHREKRIGPMTGRNAILFVPGIPEWR
jgi:hypothetical protein